MRELFSYKDILATSLVEKKVGDDACRRTYRLSRDKCVNALKENSGSCPPCLAKRCGDLLYGLLDDPKAHGIRAVDTYSPELKQPIAPTIFSRHWHTQCAKGIAHIKPQTDAKLALSTGVCEPFVWR